MVASFGHFTSVMKVVICFVLLLLPVSDGLTGSDNGVFWLMYEEDFFFFLSFEGSRVLPPSPSPFFFLFTI